MRNRITRTSSRKSRTSRKSRVKTTLKTGLIKRGVRSTKISRKDVNLNMENIIREDEYDDYEKLTCMAKIREIAQRAIKKKGLTDKEIRKTLGIKRYER